MVQLSINNRVWQQETFNEYYVYELARQLNISDFLAKMLSLRADNIDQAAQFLSPKIKDLLPDPHHLLDMQKAVDLTINAINRQHKICVFADYDVDGATSAALLKLFMQDLGVAIDIYVPDRIKEGYGPTIESMHQIKELGIDLVITVDCGISAHESITYGKSIGLTIVIIDHHLSADTLPIADAIINPNRLDETSEYGYLAAIGVTFLFVVALNTAYSKVHNHASLNLMKYLDLIALGTVCDVVPLKALNRAFVVQGLKVIQKRHNVGLKTLCDVIGINEQLNSYHLGFILGPRINAGGRVGRANTGANLLSTVSDTQALQLAKQLQLYNDERKAIESLLLEDAVSVAESQKDSNVLFIVGYSWHVGVIGIIASRLTDRFNKPSVVIAVNDRIGKASCRSIAGVNFASKIALAKSHNLIINGGGHAMAGGFTVQQDQIASLRQLWHKSFQDDLVISSEHYAIYKYAIELTINSVDFTLLETIKKLEPFGIYNHEPLFKFSDVFVLKAHIINNKHISCILLPSNDTTLTKHKKALHAIAFNVLNTPIATFLLNSKPQNFAVIGYLTSNKWQGNQKIQLKIKDIISD